MSEDEVSTGELCCSACKSGLQRNPCTQYLRWHSKGQWKGHGEEVASANGVQGPDECQPLAKAQSLVGNNNGFGAMRRGFAMALHHREGVLRWYCGIARKVCNCSCKVNTTLKKMCSLALPWGLAMILQHYGKVLRWFCRIASVNHNSSR